MHFANRWGRGRTSKCPSQVTEECRDRNQSVVDIMGVSITLSACVRLSSERRSPKVCQRQPRANFTKAAKYAFHSQKLTSSLEQCSSRVLLSRYFSLSRAWVLLHCCAPDEKPKVWIFHSCHTQKFRTFYSYNQQSTLALKCPWTQRTTDQGEEGIRRYLFDSGKHSFLQLSAVSQNGRRSNISHS